VLVNVLDFTKNDGKVRAASRRGVIEICQLVAYRRILERQSMAFNFRRPSMPLRAVAGLFLAILAMQASAKVIRDPKLKSNSVLIIDESDSFGCADAHCLHHQVDDRPGGP
jgi:hypothetical protein